MATTYEDATEEVEASVREILEENPEVSPDDAYHDLIIGMFWTADWPQDVKREIARCQLGWDPVHDADLYTQHLLNG